MRRIQRLNATTVLAFVAGIVIATAGTAGAARLITGKQIKNGSISAADLSKQLRAQLKKAGTAGPRGPAGSQGATGTPGPAQQWTLLGPDNPAATGPPPPSDPAATAFERTVEVHADGRYIAYLGQRIGAVCPAGTDCELTYGTYIDGQPRGVAQTATFKAGTTLGACDQGLNQFNDLGGGAEFVPLTSGNHTFAIKYKQTAGAAVGVQTCSTRWSFELKGPYTS